MANTNQGANPYDAPRHGGTSAGDRRPLSWISQLCAWIAAVCLVFVLAAMFVLGQVGLFSRFGHAGDLAHIVLDRGALGFCLLGFVAGIIAVLYGSRFERLAMLFLAVPYVPLMLMYIQWIISRL
jgi:hypothetical protein